MPHLKTERGNFLSTCLELPTINRPVMYAVKNVPLNNPRAWSPDFFMVVFLITFILGLKYPYVCILISKRLSTLSDT